MLRRLLILGIIFVCAFSPALALAKRITLEWTPINQALHYEIEVQDASGKKIVRRRVDQSKYRGNLNPGVYFWQIRATDRLKRPGVWANPEPLVVMAEPPVLESPNADDETSLYFPSASVSFTWKSVEGVSVYKIRLTKNGEPFLEKEVKALSFETPLAESGNYSWTVHSVLLPGVGAPAAFRTRQWQSEGAAPRSLTVQHRSLANAEIYEPSGTIPMPEKSTLRFAWSPVKNASHYEVYLHINPTAKPIGIPSEKIYRTKKTTIEVNLRDLGVIEDGKRYRWGVRAIPLRAPANFTATAPTAGASNATFEFSAEARELLRRGSVEFGTFLASTSYRFVAPDSGQAGESSAITSGLRISGIRYPKRSFGFGASFENLSLQIADQSYSVRALEAGAHYRKTLSNSTNGWILHAQVGAGWREYLEIFPTVFVDTNAQTVTVTGSNELKVSTIGAASGFDLKRYLSDRWTLQLGFLHYLPLMKTGSSQVGNLQAPGLFDNFSAGARLGWDSRYWGYTGGIGFERRGVKFNRNLSGGSTSTQTDETTSTAWSLFGGVSYSFY